MFKSSHILEILDHRPYDLPSGQWKYYQEWNDALFLHWEVPYNILRSAVPAEIPLDSLEGKFYISIVAFTMQRISPRYLPPLSFVSDFHEINLRTYVEINDKKGVYFLSIEASKSISAFVAKSLSGLPYAKSTISRDVGEFQSISRKSSFAFKAVFEIGLPMQEKTDLELWLTERYCLYLKNGREIVRYDVHHESWELRKVKVTYLTYQYHVGEKMISNTEPYLAHYSNGVKVLSWKRAYV